MSSDIGNGADQPFAQIEPYVISSVDRLIGEEFVDFWVVAGLADASFEEAASVKGGSWFVRFVNYLKSVEAPPLLLDQLLAAVNGNLRKQLVRESGLSNGPKSIGRLRPDIVLCDRDEEIRAVFEVKVIWDCVYKKYYSRVVEDRLKLTNKFRSRLSSEVALYQLVFFLGFPQLLYPRGSWYGKDYNHDRPVVFHGVGNQWSFLQSLMGSTGESAQCHFVSRPLTASNDVQNLISKWHSAAYVPAVQWAFNANDHLRDAAVAAAIWRY